MKNLILAFSFLFCISTALAANFTCPEDNCLISRCQYPNKDDSTTFWKCIGGQATLIPCLPGLEYDDDVAVKMCVVKSPKSRQARSLAANITCPDICLISLCQYPNEDDSSTYWVCIGGQPTLVTCLPGQEYDDKVKMCVVKLPKGRQARSLINSGINLLPNHKPNLPDWPTKGTTARKPSTPQTKRSTTPRTRKTTTTRRTPTGRPTTTTSTTTTPRPETTRSPKTTARPTTTRSPPTTARPTKATTASNEQPDFKCPETVCKNSDCLHPNPENCAKFWQCDAQGRKFLKKCPDGLEFNNKVKVCDWPSAIEHDTCNRTQK